MSREALYVSDHSTNLLASEIELASFDAAHQQQRVTARVVLDLIPRVTSKDHGTVVAPPSVHFCLLK